MKNSFRTQLIYGFVTILSLLIIAFTYTIVSYQSNFLNNEGLTQAKNRSMALATVSKVWVMSNDYIGLEEVINNFSVYDDIVFAAIIDMDGKIIAHSDKTLVGEYIADSERILFLKQILEPTDIHTNVDKILLQNNIYIDVIKVIHNVNQHLGFVHLRIDQRHRQQNIYDTTKKGLFFTIISIIIGTLFAYLISNFLIKQLLNLVKTLKEVRDGKKDVKADEDVVQEIAELAHEFNDLMENLNESEALINQLNERQKLALVGSNAGVWDWNIVDDTVYFSPRWKEMLGYADSELTNEFSSWQSRVHPDDIDITLKELQEHIDGDTDYYQGVHRLKHKDGHWVWILDRGKGFYENGEAVRMIGTHTDITKDKEAQVKYAQQALIIQQVNDSVISTDLQGNITSFNRGSELMLGYTEKEVLGKNMSIIHREEDVQQHIALAEELLKVGSSSTDAYLVSKSKELVEVTISLSVLKDENEIPIGLIGISKDISQRKKAEKELLKQKEILEYQAHHDSLTQLPNRLLFNDRLNHAIKSAKRNSHKIALLFIDLDHFKEINDSLGHTVGDEVLKVVTQRLNKTIREIDTLSRLGGDEFTIIMENIFHGEDASRLAQKILGTLSLPINIDDHILYVSSSIGICLYPEDGDSAINLLKYADSAMYKAKDEGRNNFQFYSNEMTELALERVVMETQLRESLQNEDFKVYYQPQINAEYNELIGMEALVRWQHPTMGLLSPARFIPIAESTGLIIILDKFVMKTAMTQFAQWYKDGYNPGILAMNLTAQQLQSKDFLTMFKNLIKETGCKPEWLELEVTEGQIMMRPDEAIKILNNISDLGVELAIDDFGTGYSSLSYLKKLPINKLKIDQSFVRDLPYDEDDIGISKAVIALAKSLNLKIIAEGVETKEQKEFLVHNGCSNIQGYLYSKPVVAEDIETILINGVKYI